MSREKVSGRESEVEARTLAAELVDALNRYEGEDEWQDVIYAKFYDLVGWDRTDEWDPGYMSDVVVMTDGSVAVYDDMARMWVEADFPSWVSPDDEDPTEA